MLGRGVAQAVTLSGVSACRGRWKLPPPAGEPRLALLYHIWFRLNYDFYEKHVFWRQALGERLLFFIVLPENTKLPSCSEAEQSSDLPPGVHIC